MTQHWPLPIAAGLITAAAAFGLWQRERASDAARPRSPQTARTVTVSEAADPGDDGPSAPTPPSPSSPAAAPASGPAAPGAPAPAPKSAAVTVLPPEQHAQLWNDLKTALQTRTAVAPSDKGNGAVNFSMDGTAVDLQTPPNWSVTIYNINPKLPEAETPNFSKCVAIVSETLGLDPNQKAVSSDNQRTYLRTLTKLGMASVTRDPSGANTWIVKPANTPRQAIKQVEAPKPVEAAKPAAPVPAPPPAAPAQLKPAAPAVEPKPAAPAPAEKKGEGENF